MRGAPYEVIEQMSATTSSFIAEELLLNVQRFVGCLSWFGVYIYIPGTQMTLVLNGKGLLLEGSTPKIEDKQVPGIDMYINNPSCN